MRTFAAVIVLSALAGMSKTQSIDPDSVPLSTRQNWCQSQTTQCPLLCLQLPGSSATTSANDCDADNLTYDCVCGNGQSPNASQYTQTLPFYICQEWGNQCVAGCNNDNTCANNCRAEHPCGAQSPKRVNSTTSSTMPATAPPTGTSTGVNTADYGAFGSSPTGSSNNNNKGAAIAALDVGKSYGLAIVLSCFFAGFALVL